MILHPIPIGETPRILSRGPMKTTQRSKSVEKDFLPQDPRYFHHILCALISSNNSHYGFPLFSYSMHPVEDGLKDWSVI